MIEKQIEAKIAAALRSLALDGLQVVGAWESCAAGSVRNRETAESTAKAAVAVGVRSYPNYTIPTVEIPGTIAIAVRIERDPTGDRFDAYASGVTALLDNWHRDICAADGAGALDVEGFNAAGFSMTGGGAPTIDRAAGVASVAFSFTIYGCMVAPEPPTNSEEEL